MKNQKGMGRNQFIMMFFAFSFGMILSNLLDQQSKQNPTESDAPLFIYKGIDKKKEDLSSDMKADLVQLETQKHALLERAALKQHLYQYARDKGMSLDKAGDEIFKFTLPSEAQVNRFYQDNAEKINKPFFEVRDFIYQQLKLQQIKQAKQKVLSHLIAQGDLAILPEN